MHKILVIDDDQITLELIQLILEEFVEGEVITINNAVEAVRYIDKNDMNKIDLVICDWQMPEYDGITLLKTVRSKRQDLPFLMVTGTATRDLVMSAKKAGASEFIAKPFKNHDLTDRVAKLLK
ncbi:response regulator [Aliiglaciecola sp. 3_MG-2023]|uniref:response regulator n=1 Tax=Aliiglaciecola sp. 3_MG-2023 TaxID=3062644 RepID=UPI0026E37FD1|nr:response regulator [Aliiglaciecola sp. 3_MG-2023]MDO6694123.1 response regulator [Aliiglaciecola sp. 3_MG-2023]